MTLMFHAACRRGLAAIAVGTAVSFAVACAITSAHASLTPGTGWTAVTLPANYAIANGSNGPVPSPVSCAPGKHFCVVVAANSAVKGPGPLRRADGAPLRAAAVVVHARHCDLVPRDESVLHLWPRTAGSAEGGQE